MLASEILKFQTRKKQQQKKSLHCGLTHHKIDLIELNI